ncbi:hypothetical protein NHJ6243_009858 [Beauveria neobassiana]
MVKLLQSCYTFPPAELGLLGRPYLVQSRSVAENASIDFAPGVMLAVATAARKASLEHARRKALRKRSAWVANSVKIVRLESDLDEMKRELAGLSSVRATLSGLQEQLQMLLNAYMIPS